MTPAAVTTPDELLTTTRTVRRRLDLTRPVPLTLVRECLEIAIQAPSGGNRQHWHWIVLTDPDVRAAVGEVYARSVREYHASPKSPLSPDASPDPDRARTRQRLGDSVTYLAEHIAEVPVLVIPCLRLDRLPDGSQARVWNSLFPAVWSYMLAARARGLGTALTSGHLTYEREVAELLGLPDDIRQGALVPTAYYTGETFRPASRRPLEESLHLDRW